MTKVEEYNLRLYINGSLQATTNVPANTTMVDIFTAFGPNITRERYTNYSLSVAAINSAGIGEFSKSDVGELGYINQQTFTFKNLSKAIHFIECKKSNTNNFKFMTR